MPDGDDQHCRRPSLNNEGLYGIHVTSMVGWTHPLMAAHSESLAGYWLAISNALYKAVSNDCVLMLTWQDTYKN